RRDPLPVPVVVRLVAVYEPAHEPPLAPAPVDAELLRQERGDDQPHAVVHPALGAQLPHPGVHKRKDRPALAPRLEVPLGAAPPDPAAVALLELRAGVPREVQEDVRVEVAPAQLAPEG